MQTTMSNVSQGLFSFMDGLVDCNRNDCRDNEYKDQRDPETYPSLLPGSAGRNHSLLCILQSRKFYISHSHEII